MAENKAERVKTVKTDGEEVTFFSPEEMTEQEKWDLKKAAAKNPFGKLSMARISTQGPER